jgi:hypothetical protein
MRYYLPDARATLMRPRNRSGASGSESSRRNVWNPAAAVSLLQALAQAEVLGVAGRVQTVEDQQQLPSLLRVREESETSNAVSFPRLLLLICFLRVVVAAAITSNVVVVISAAAKKRHCSSVRRLVGRPLSDMRESQPRADPSAMGARQPLAVDSVDDSLHAQAIHVDEIVRVR